MWTEEWISEGRLIFSVQLKRLRNRDDNPLFEDNSRAQAEREYPVMYGQDSEVGTETDRVDDHCSDAPRN